VDSEQPGARTSTEGKHEQSAEGETTEEQPGAAAAEEDYLTPPPVEDNASGDVGEPAQYRSIIETITEVKEAGRSGSRVHIARSVSIHSDPCQPGHKMEIRALPSGWFASTCADPLAMGCSAGIMRAEPGSQAKPRCYNGLCALC